MRNIVASIRIMYVSGGHLVTFSDFNILKSLGLQKAKGTYDGGKQAHFIQIGKTISYNDKSYIIKDVITVVFEGTLENTISIYNAAEEAFDYNIELVYYVEDAD